MSKAVIAIIAIITAFLVGVQLAPIIPLSIAWTIWGIIIILLAIWYVAIRK